MAAVLTSGPVPVPVYYSPLVAACGGGLYFCYPYGMVTAATGSTFRSNVLVSMAFLNLAVYLTDGGSYVYVMPMSTKTVYILSATAGSVPPNCFLCCNWRGRLVLAGDSSSPQNFYMSRVGNPTDFNYNATDPAAAVAGNFSESGQIGEPIVALIPYTDDYMLVGCTNSLWMLQGDPADGGSIVRVSDQMGLVSPNAWCIDPSGLLYFIARGGLYSVKPIWEFYQPPQLLSGETYDQYFQNILNGSYYISMQWDVDAKYMHIFATPTDGATVGQHLIFDQRNGGLWPQAYPVTHGPTATARYAANNVNGTGQRAILLGGWDGYVRQWTSTALNDDGTTIQSQATMGPLKPTPGAAILKAVTVDLGELTKPDELSNPSNWGATVVVAAGPDAQNVTESSPLATHPYSGVTTHSVYLVTGTLDRRQVTYRQRFRGNFFSLTLGTLLDPDGLPVANTYWSFESALLEFVPGGRARDIR